MLWRWLVFIVSATVLGAASAQAPSPPPSPPPVSVQTAKPPVASLSDLLAEPSILTAALSPSGKRVAVLHQEKTRFIVAVYDTEKVGAPLYAFTAEGAGVARFLWKDDDHLLTIGNLPGLYGRQKMAFADAEESRKFYIRVLYVINVPKRETMLLAPEGFGVQRSQLIVREVRWGSPFGFVSGLEQDPNNVLIAISNYDGADIYRLDVTTGAVKLAERGQTSTVDFTVDEAGRAIARVDVRGNLVRTYMRQGNGWKQVAKRRFEDESDFEIIGAGKNPGELIVRARRADADKIGVHIFDVAAGAMTSTLLEDKARDVSGVAVNWKGEFRSASFTGDVAEYYFVTEAYAVRWRALRKRLGEFVNVTPISASRDERHWLLRAEAGDMPSLFFLHDAETDEIRLLGEVYPEMRGKETPQVQAITYRARDATPIPALLVRPHGPPAMRPTIVMVHGGPVLRVVSSWEDSELRLARVISAAGYNVVLPNFRGSGGFGLAWEQAGYRQWGKLMQTDLEDAAAAMVRAKIAPQDRVGIFGWSYGGYAALVGATMTPDKFTCAVAGAGLSDLEAFMRW